MLRLYGGISTKLCFDIYRYFVLLFGLFLRLAPYALFHHCLCHKLSQLRHVVRLGMTVGLYER